MSTRPTNSISNPDPLCGEDPGRGYIEFLIKRKDELGLPIDGAPAFNEIQFVLATSLRTEQTPPRSRFSELRRRHFGFESLTVK